MKLIILIAGGRTGSGLLHSLFDGHEQVLQLPSEFYYDIFWKKAKHIKDKEKIADLFLKDYPAFFDSRINSKERHDQLGKKRNNYFKVDPDIFKKKLIRLLNNKKIKFLPLLLALHQAYNFSKHNKFNYKKILLLHLHHLHRLDIFKKYNFEIIYTVREPFANITSSFNKIYKNQSDDKRYIFKSFQFMLDKILNCIHGLIKFNKKIYVIKLENLHRHKSALLKNLCKLLGIKFSNTLLKSTVNNLEWWGDSDSKKYLNGLNYKFKNNVNYNYFYKKDLTILNYYLYNQLQTYNYINKINNSYNIKNKIIEFMRFLPLKMEIILFLKLLGELRIKELLFSQKFLIKRFSNMRLEKINKKKIFIF